MAFCHLRQEPTLSQKHHLDRALIRDFTLFAGMSSADLDAALARAEVKSYVEGEAVFEGDTATHFYILLHGRLKVVQATAEGAQAVVQHIHPGEMAGFARALRRPDFGPAAR